MALGIFNSKARIAKDIAEELFAGIGIDAPLNDVERELVDNCNVDEDRYRSEKRILMAFAIERALINFEEDGHTQIAKAINTEFAALMTQMAKGKPREALEGLILRIGSYDKALRNESGLKIAVPAAFADWVDEMNPKARPLLITLGLVTYSSIAEAVRAIVGRRTTHL